MGRRGNGVNYQAALPQNQWYFIRDDRVGGSNNINAQGFMSLYKSDLATGNIPQ